MRAVVFCVSSFALGAVFPCVEWPLASCIFCPSLCFRSAFSQLEAWRRALVKLWEEMKWRIVEGADDREVATTYLPSATMPRVA